ncbi:MAG: LTA synthase family protein [Thermodesulfovibrionales bacterium]|nr:LTA synthase family protein [Thermodesulfovibrionales bacterium]
MKPRDISPIAKSPSRYFFGICIFIPLAVARLYCMGMLAGGAFTGLTALAAFRGFVSDLLITLLVLFPLAYISGLFTSRRLVRPVGFFIWGIWVIMASANVEHIKANGANINFVFAHLALNNEFIMGSVFSVNTLVSLIVVLAVSAPLCILLSRLRPINATVARVAVALIIIPVLALPALPALSIRNDFSYWLQMNLAEENIRYMIRQAPPTGARDLAERKNLGEFFQADLSGRKIVKYPQKKYNVLLVLVEGLNHGYLEQGWIPGIESIHESNVSYTQYASLQSQTNRGLYALLCGDYPNFLFSEAKSDYVALYGAVKKCLPEALGREGYNTAFMQGAVLSYMQKDRFAKSAGFMESYGSESFESFIKKNAWGVDDSTLFHYVRAKISELSKKPEPWFLTALTLSTHHPFNVPGVRNPSAEQAYRFADSAFREFMGSLDKDGLLEDTVVIITTDEGKSAGATGGLNSEVEKNHAVLAMMLPGTEADMTQEDLFTQSDILISVLDYLGLPIPDDAFGRSIFRQYGKGREVIFASSIASKIFNYSADSLLTVCDMDFNCSSYHNRAGLLFGGEFVPKEASQKRTDRLRRFIGLNEISFKGLSGGAVYYRGEMDYRGDRYLVGDHKISLKKGDRVTWRLKIRPSGTIGVRLAVQDIRLLANGTMDLRPFMEVRKWVTGETYVLERTYTAEGDITTLATNITVSDERKEGYHLDYLSIDVRRNRLENP